MVHYEDLSDIIAGLKKADNNQNKIELKTFASHEISAKLLFFVA